MTYEERLQAAVYSRQFDREKALALSTELQEAEAKGYELSRREEALWERLTARIEGGQTS